MTTSIGLELTPEKGQKAQQPKPKSNNLDVHADSNRKDFQGPTDLSRKKNSGIFQDYIKFQGQTGIHTHKVNSYQFQKQKKL